MNLSAGSIYIEDIHTEDLDIDVDAGEVQVDSFLTNDLINDRGYGPDRSARKDAGRCRS